jgi:RimJ/RimL family protein N-acetyltransferase
VQAYRADLVAGHAHLSAMLTPPAHRMGWPLEGMALFINYLFSNWGFNKLYAEVYDYNLDQFRRMNGLFVKEGILRQHAKLGNRYSNLHIFALYAEAWTASGGGFGNTPLGFNPTKSLSRALAQAFKVP